jgi:hypothetical protein
MHRERRRFLGWLGGASLLGAAGIPAVPSAGRAQPRGEHPQPIDSTWDVSWTERVTGMHRAVFDSPEPSEGAALFRAVAWCDHYKEVYGVERQDMSAVVVIRHMAISLVMDDAYWSRYKVGKELKLRSEKGKWAEVNPISAQSVGADERAKKYKIETFMANGGIVLACSWAFGGMVQQIKAREKVDQAAADAQARAHLIPGVILQPNGIFAVLRAQEAGCHYIIAS